VPRVHEFSIIRRIRVNEEVKRQTVY